MKIEAKLDGDNVVISTDSFSHIMNCLVNQKFMSVPEKQGVHQDEIQRIIDDVWRQCMDLLSFVKSDTEEQEPTPRPPFKQALTTLINQYSKENDSDTPDFILAKFLTDTLKAFNKATNRREEWYGNDEEEEHDWQFPDNCFRCMEGDQKEYTEQPSATGQILTEYSTLSYPANIKFTVKYHAE